MLQHETIYCYNNKHITLKRDTDLSLFPWRDSNTLPYNNVYSVFLSAFHEGQFLLKS